MSKLPILDQSKILSILSLNGDPVAIYTGKELHIQYASEAMRKLWPKDIEVIDQTAEAIFLDTNHQLITTLKEVWEANKPFSETVTLVGQGTSSPFQPTLYQIDYQPLRNDEGKTYAILHTAKKINTLSDRNHHDLEMKADLEQLTSINAGLRRSSEDMISLNDRLNESQQHFKLLVEQAPVAILVFKGPDLVIEMANPPILEILHRGKEIIGKPILESMPELRGEPAVELIFDVFRTGKSSYGTEVPVRMLRDGETETRYFNFSYRPIIDEGKIIGVMDLAVEVTDQVISRHKLEEIIAEKTLLEKSLRANEQRLQGILDTMAEGVGIVDAKGQLVYANEMAQRILGLSINEIKERSYVDARWRNLRIDGTPLSDEEHPMAIMMRTGIPLYDQEIAVQPEGADRIYISINAAPIFDDQGAISGGIGTFMDVTNRRKIAMQKDDFISVASHELKTPVTSLKGYLQLLARLNETAKPEMTKKLIDQANKSMDKLTELINGLLDVTRMGQGGLHIQKKNFDLVLTASDCVQQLSGDSGHRIVLQGESSLILHADEQQIEQVIINLLNNAVKYAAESEKIIVSIQQEQQHAKVSVTDFGQGIAANQIQNLFDRYYRAHQGLIQHSGLGLGLYISSEIIKKHGGEIGVESEHGKGSTFWFSIPLL